MSLWNKTNKLPSNLGADKRNVVATDKGFVRIKKYTDANGNARSKEEILVAMGPGTANSSNFGTAFVTDMWHSTSSVVHNNAVTTTISFSEPLSSAGLHGGMKINVANTAGGAAVVGTTTADVSDGNKIVFTWTPAVAGTYKVQAQTAANSTATAANTRSTNSGTELVSWVIGGTASNSAGVVVAS